MPLVVRTGNDDIGYTPLDLTGATPEFVARERPGEAVVATGTVRIPTPTNGECFLRLPADQTDFLVPKTHHWEFSLSWAADDKTTFLTGDMSVKRGYR